MPEKKIVFYQNESGRAPALEWMRKLEAKPLARLRAAMEMLARHGHKLKRPHAATLHSGVSELRARVGKARYRLLYFVHGGNLVVVSHGFSKKESRVPEREIQRALGHKALFETDPNKHTYEGGK